MNKIKRIMNKWIRIFNDVKLKYKLAIVYILVVIIPFFLFFTILDARVKNLLMTNLEFSASNGFEQTFTLLSYKMHNIEKAVTTIATNDTIREIISKDPTDISIGMQLVDMTKMRQFIENFENKYDITKIRLYVNEDYIYSNENINFFSIDSIQNTKWYQYIIENKKNNYFLPSHYLENPDEENLALVKVILNPNDYRIIESIVRADFNKQDMLDTISNAKALENSIVMIYNNDKELVLTPDYELLNKYNISIGQLYNYPSNGNKFSTLNQGSDTFLIQTRNINNSDWYLASIIPKNEIIKKVTSQYNSLWLILISVLLLIYVFINLISLTITNRIHKLIYNIKEINNGYFHEIQGEDSKDEIGVLTRNYNYMVNRLNHLMEEKYKSGQQLKMSELKALQAQINPHFLYNTLEMINWLVKRDRTEDIITVTTALSNLYKISLNRGEDLISIRDELLHVESYIKIQNMRFNNKLNYITEIDESLLEYNIPKLILQPIVENSIFHGILEKDDQCGTIMIKLYSPMEDFICLEVRDDGVGIPEDKLDTLLSTKESPGKEGSQYGLKNIYMRLKLMSDDNNLVFTSQVGKGTTVKVLIKKLTAFSK